MTVEEAVAKNLRRCLAEREMTMTTLSKLCGIRRETIFSYANAIHGIRLNRIYFIAKALGVTVNDLLEGCDE